jgi:phospholipase C
VKDNNGGFVRDFGQSYPHASSAELQQVMWFWKYGSLPALHQLAQHFLICDHWYASVPGPTWPNRLFALSGTSLGRISMPEGLFNWNFHWYDQSTIFDRLNEKSRSWKVYFGDFPLSFLFVHQWEPRNVRNYQHMTGFYDDAAGDPKNFPEFAFIEPSYLPPGANDDHPPHDVLAGETLIANVYNAIRRNESLWQQVLLVLLWDEHGGFYDHVPPEKAEPPDLHSEEHFKFDMTGLRVPCVLISPWVKNGVLSTKFDHTSLLKFLIDKWQLGPLGNRTAKANTFSDTFLATARTDTPERIEVPVPAEPTTPMSATAAATTLTSGQKALVALSHALESMAGEDPGTVAARSKHILSNAQSHLDIAMERVDSFIEKVGTKSGK